MNLTNFKIDNLQYCNWSKEIFQINREAQLDAIHVTIAYHEDFDEVKNNVKVWNKHFQDYKDLIFHGKTFIDIEKSHAENKTAIFFGFQNCSPIEDNIQLIEKVNPKNPVDFLDKVATEKLEPFIDKSYSRLASYVKAYEQKMVMAREVIADKGIWTAKKRYILNVHDSEGVRYAEPQLKVMGIEAVKSSTPAPCRDMIKSALKVIINEDETTLNTFIQSFRENFMKYPPENIAYPRSCNNLKHYADTSTIFKKGTPMHVKGALVYNFILKKQKLTNKYPLIQEGDKIKFIEVRTPNPYQTNVISFMTRLPDEFDLINFIN